MLCISQETISLTLKIATKCVVVFVLTYKSQNVFPADSEFTVQAKKQRQNSRNHWESGAAVGPSNKITKGEFEAHTHLRKLKTTNA